MSENVTCETELKQKQIDWLDEMTEKHGLPDRSKTLRCLVTFAMEEPDHEESIFTKIRCTNC